MTDTRAILTALFVFATPVLICCAIVLFDEGVKTALLFDFFKLMALFLVIGLGISAFMMYREGQSTHTDRPDL